jgi:hypothetical protein
MCSECVQEFESALEGHGGFPLPPEGKDEWVIVWVPTSSSKGTPKDSRIEGEGVECIYPLSLLLLEDAALVERPKEWECFAPSPKQSKETATSLPSTPAAGLSKIPSSHHLTQTQPFSAALPSASSQSHQSSTRKKPSEGYRPMSLSARIGEVGAYIEGTVRERERERERIRAEKGKKTPTSRKDTSESIGEKEGKEKEASMKTTSPTTSSAPQLPAPIQTQSEGIPPPASTSRSAGVPTTTGGGADILDLQLRARAGSGGRGVGSGRGIIQSLALPAKGGGDVEMKDATRAPEKGAGEGTPTVPAPAPAPEPAPASTPAPVSAPAREVIAIDSSPLATPTQSAATSTTSTPVSTRIG